MRRVGAIGLLAMVMALAYGVLEGDFSGEGAVLVDLAWGRVSLVDIYTGVFVFGAWIVWREPSMRRATPWLALLVVFGNFGIAPYLLWISRSKTTVAEALTGGRH
jgi:hypothetical protein